MSKRILAAIEMVGTYNALESAFTTLTKEHDARISFAAAGALKENLAKRGTPCFTTEDDVDRVFTTVSPDLVLVGVISGVKTPGGSGLERAYALAALNRGIPVVVYRDFFGLHPWIDEVTRHPKAPDLLHFFMFAETTVRLIRKLELPCKEAIAVGSGYYDGDVTRDWPAVRERARKAMGWTNDDFVVVFSPGSTRERVIQTLIPTVQGIKSGRKSMVFVPTFHPKDPDAPYAIVPGGPATPKPSVYDSVIDELHGSSARVVREPAFRNVVPDGKARVAAADFIVMNPLSIDTYTAVYARVPAVVTALSLTEAEALENRNDIQDFDFVVEGAMDIVSTPLRLMEYIIQLTKNPETPSRLLEAQARFSPSVATPTIVDQLLRVAGD